MFSLFRSAKKNPEALKAAAEFIKHEIAVNKVVVFSKTYCPHCTRAKKALNAELRKSDYKVIELESRSDCAEIQDVLLEMTGGRTVPRVFIGGQCIGGGSETYDLQKSGQLKRLLHSIGL